MNKHQGIVYALLRDIFEALRSERCMEIRSSGHKVRPVGQPHKANHMLGTLHTTTHTPTSDGISHNLLE